jgi:hypothetical protein
MVVTVTMIERKVGCMKLTVSQERKKTLKKQEEG